MDVFQGTQSEESYIATTKSPIISTSNIAKHRSKDRVKSQRVYSTQFDYNTQDSTNKQTPTCYNSTSNNDTTNHLNSETTNHLNNHSKTSDATKCFNGTTSFNNTTLTFSNNNSNKSIIKCSICNKTFNNSSALAKHKLIHSNERKYTCPQCGKSFKRQDHLNGHMLTHAEKKPYQCQLQNCDKSYCDSRSLKRHYDNQHRDFLLQQQQLSNQDSVMLTPKLTPKSASFTKVESIFSFDNISDDHFSASCYQMSPVSPNINRDNNIKALLFDEYKPMECKVCSKRFKNTSALNGHMRLHGGFVHKSKTTEGNMLLPGNTQNKPSNISTNSDNIKIINNNDNNNNSNNNNTKNTNNNKKYVEKCGKAGVNGGMENGGVKLDEKTIYDKKYAEETPCDDLCDNDALVSNKEYSGVQMTDKLAHNDKRLRGINDDKNSTSDKPHDDKEIDEVFTSDNIKHEYYCFENEFNKDDREFVAASKVDFNTKITEVALQDIPDKDVIDKYDNKEIVESCSPQIIEDFIQPSKHHESETLTVVSGYEYSSGQGCSDRAIKIEPHCVNEGETALSGSHTKMSSPNDSEIVDIIMSLSEEDPHVKEVYSGLENKMFPGSFAMQQKCLNNHFNGNLSHANLPHSDLSHEQSINNVIINENESGFDFDAGGLGGKYQEPRIFNFPPQESISTYAKLLESNNINKSSLFSPIANKLSELDIMSPRPVVPSRPAVPTGSMFSSRPMVPSMAQMVPQAIDLEKAQASLKVDEYVRQFVEREQQKNGALNEGTFDNMGAQEMTCDGAINSPHFTTSPHLTSLSHHTIYQNDTSDIPHFHNDSYIHNSQTTQSFDNFVDQRMYKSMDLSHEFQTNQLFAQQKNLFEEKKIQFYQQKCPQNLHPQQQVYYQNYVASSKQQSSPRQHAIYRHLDNRLQNHYVDDYSVDNSDFNLSNKLKRKFKPQPLVIPHSANNYISQTDLPYLNASPSHPYTPLDPGNLSNRHCGQKIYQSFSSIDTKRSNSPPPIFRRRMHSPSFAPSPVPVSCWSSSRPPPQSAPITNKRQYTFEFQEVYQGADNSPGTSNYH